MVALMERAADEMLMACDGAAAVAAIPIAMAIAKIRFNMTLSLVLFRPTVPVRTASVLCAGFIPGTGESIMLRNHWAGFVLR
ncbi:hypothetical protein ADU59_02640 [Pararhizobium polonicum]|uniref:Uncharacterized protein n=1 Tax=Pararhizobium polonicum TaxID=1612624 RepID=A0A1C7P6R3_9HYPH|nr:hypothetical protein ADU59_02640 [Pararhizobium polonicum]